MILVETLRWSLLLVNIECLGPSLKPPSSDTWELRGGEMTYALVSVCDEFGFSCKEACSYFSLLGIESALSLCSKISLAFDIAFFW